MYTVPNQNVITIHRSSLNNNFLSISNQNWQSFIREEKDYTALALYLYFASNANGFCLAISPQAVENAIGMPRSTYYKVFNRLVEKGYVIPRSTHRFDFYEFPQKQGNLSGNLVCFPQEQKSLQKDIEIDKIDITDKKKCVAFEF